MAKRTKIPVGKDRITIEWGILLTRGRKHYLANFVDPGGTRHYRAFTTLDGARK